MSNEGHGPANQATRGERRRFSFSYDLQTFRGDLFGGVTAAVVGLNVLWTPTFADLEWRKTRREIFLERSAPSIPRRAEAEDRMRCR